MNPLPLPFLAPSPLPSPQGPQTPLPGVSLGQLDQRLQDCFTRVSQWAAGLHEESGKLAAMAGAGDEGARVLLGDLSLCQSRAAATSLKVTTLRVLVLIMRSGDAGATVGSCFQQQGRYVNCRGRLSVQQLTGEVHKSVAYMLLMLQSRLKETKVVVVSTALSSCPV